MTEENNQAAAASETKAPAFAIQRIYLKDISFETPMGIEAFTKAFKPAIQQDMNIQVAPVSEDLFEVTLFLTITARIENRAVFLVEIKQAGLFVISGVEAPQMSHMIHSTCPQILFPYAREAIDSIIIRGGFPPLMLAPLNFDAIFVQAVQAAKEQATAKSEPSETIN
jgi:preprotein translocase subunit SecB